jgi:hypothetical protein
MSVPDQPDPGEQPLEPLPDQPGPREQPLEPLPDQPGPGEQPLEPLPVISVPLVPVPDSWIKSGQDEPVAHGLNCWDALVYLLKSRSRAINLALVICAMAVPLAGISAIVYFASEAQLLASIGWSAAAVGGVAGVSAIARAIHKAKGGKADQAPDNNPDIRNDDG